MDVAWWAFIVSGLSMVTAVGSLTWNVTSFRWSGPLVQVEAKLQLEARPFPKDEVGGIQDWQVNELLGQRTLNCITVKVRVINKGRLAIGINKVDVKLNARIDSDFTFYASERYPYENR